MTHRRAGSEGKDQQKKIRLLQEIGHIRNKISQLSQLESQIATIEGLIKIQQSKTSQNSISSSKKLQTKTTIGNNSNKKIKIYELKKKLQSRSRDYKDRHVAYLTRMKSHEQQISTITQTNQLIRQEKDNSMQLDRLYASLVGDINRIQEKCNENAQLLQNQKSVLLLCQQERAKHIAEIKRLKKIIKVSSENTEPDDDIAYSEHEPTQRAQNEEDDMIVSPLKFGKFRFSLSGANSPQLLSDNCMKMHEQQQQQILIGQDQEEEIKMSPAYISFKKLNKQSPQLSYNKEQGQFKQIAKSCLQFQQQMHVLEQKLQKDSKFYQSLLQSASLIKRGNRNLQASAKHSMVTLDLLKSRLENVMRSGEQECRELVANIEKCEALYDRLRIKQGERGQIRGKLGIKVQNTRMLGIINESISLDLHKMTERVPRIRALSGQCLELAKRLIGPQKIVSQLQIE